MVAMRFKLPVMALLLALGTAGDAAAQKKAEKKEPRRQAEVRLQVIQASSSGQGPNDAVTLVPAELKSLLRYSRYTLLDSAFLRATERSEQRIAIAGDMLGEVEFEVQPDGQIQVTVELRRSGGLLLDTRATVKSGETVVLGASRMRDGSTGLIVLFTTKLIP
jgi:hypothetical protein